MRSGRAGKKFLTNVASKAVGVHMRTGIVNGQIFIGDIAFVTFATVVCNNVVGCGFRIKKNTERYLVVRITG